jgi:tetratricopeptide (TPR) repeat protein
MPRRNGSLLFAGLAIGCVLSTIHATAQVERLVIAAGTDEDKALAAISAEQDPQKKLAMYLEYVQKFSANPTAVAYGDWQIEQTYQTAGDLQKALEYGDKALAAAPHNLDILVSQASVAQQAKNNAKVMDCVAAGGEACRAAAKQTKPDGMSDDEFARKVKDDVDAVQNNCDFLDTTGFNVIATETDPKTQMTDIERFSTAFPESKFQETISGYALNALSQLKDNSRLVAYGDKMLAANPNSLPALLLLANFYSDDKTAGSAAKAISYSHKAIEVAKADATDADKSRKLSGGAAHSTIGWVYLKQDKSAAAIPELKAAATLLKGQDDQQYARALYGLGFAYGKLNKLTEARDVLTEAVKIPGPLQPMSQDLLAKVNSARAKGK